MLESLSGMVGQVTLTQENTTLIALASEKSDQLIGQTFDLDSAVSFIHLRNGSAEEARQRTIDAALHVHIVGLPQSTLDFHDLQGAFVDRDLYIFSFNRSGQYSIFGDDARRVGGVRGRWGLGYLRNRQPHNGRSAPHFTSKK